MARSAVGGVAHSSGLPWANALAMTIYVTSNPAYFYNCSFISFSFIASKRERNASKEREKRDQMIRVFRNYVSEPSFDYPADNIVYVFLNILSFIAEMFANMYFCSIVSLVTLV